MACLYLSTKAPYRFSVDTVSTVRISYALTNFCRDLNIDLYSLSIISPEGVGWDDQCDCVKVHGKSNCFWVYVCYSMLYFFGICCNRGENKEAVVHRKKF